MIFMNFKYLLFITLFLIEGIRNTYGQQQMELQQESMAERDEQVQEEDVSLEELEHYRNHPLNLNTANEDELKALTTLSALQIEHFIQYRRFLGKLLAIYELQSVPHWDISVIKQLLPYISITDDKRLYDDILSRLTGGNNSMFIRSSRVPERSRGYKVDDESMSRYIGSSYKVMIKYKYAYKNLLQYGIIAEKDAGEQFFRGKQRYGFDFYSAHFFLRKSGIVKALAFGDYNVSLGQGLILWQGTGTGKGVEVMAVKRQGPVLKPYHSVGEYNFQRGAGITLERKNWETTAFASKRKLDAVIDDNFITSINSSGYHRTQNEILHKGSADQVVTGLNVRYRGPCWISSLNMVHYNYSDIIQRKDEPYNYYAMGGRSFTYAGADYSYTLKNMHFFGEIATMNARHTAMLHGLLASLDKRVDAALVWRDIDKAYVSVYGNAFTENTYPGNERGLYAGITVRPSGAVSVSAYSDIFHFPWLKYRVDAPSYGREYLLHVNYKPDKKTEVYLRYRYKAKEMNNMIGVGPVPLQNLRVHTGIKLSSSVTVRNRAEMTWYKPGQEDAGQGFLLLTDILYKPLSGSWSGNVRCAWFDTDDYNSRIYAYENDVLYSSSVNAVFNKGTRYYINIRKEIPLKAIKKNLNIYLKWSQTVYEQPVIGSGLDEIQGKLKSELKIQLNIL